MAAETCWVSEQDPPHRGHDRLPEHHGLRLQGDAGDPVSTPHGRGAISVPGSLCHPAGLSRPLSCHREYRSRFTNTETLLFCMRVMVGVIILYDHVHPVGAFAKTSKIDVSGWGGGVTAVPRQL